MIFIFSLTNSLIPSRPIRVRPSISSWRNDRDLITFSRVRSFIFNELPHHSLSLSLSFFYFMAGNRGPLNVTIVQVGRGNGGGGDGGSDLLRLEPPLDLRPVPSPLSDTSTTLQSDNNDTLAGGERSISRYIRFKDHWYLSQLYLVLNSANLRHLFSLSSHIRFKCQKRKLVHIFLTLYTLS